MGPSQRPLPDNTKHSQQTDIHAPAGFEPAIPTSEWPQTDVLHSVTGPRWLTLDVIIHLQCLFKMKSDWARMHNVTEEQRCCVVR